MRSYSNKLQKIRLSDQVIDRLIHMVSNGELKTGDKLPPEPQLMEQFGVGRSSIREAVGALELIGLVTVRPGDGTRIIDSLENMPPRSIGLSLINIGYEKIQELAEARSELEQTIARLSAERATPEDVQTLKNQHQKLIQAGNARRKLIAADLGFHTALAHACHNRILIRFFLELLQPINHWMEQKAKHNWGFDSVAQEHEAILKAVENRDPEDAQSAMKAHIDTAGKKLIAAMS